MAKWDYDMWQQWTSNPPQDYKGQENFVCNLEPRGVSPGVGHVVVMVRGSYNTREYIGEVKVPAADFADRRMWETQVRSLFRQYCSQNWIGV